MIRKGKSISMAYTEDIHKTGNDLIRSLNRLERLHASETATRHGSFIGATQELGVTPAAVGQLIRALEDQVGHPLLHRARSDKERLTLVSEVQDVLHKITQGSGSLESRLNKLYGRRTRSVVIITASQVLVMSQLMSCLNHFSQAYRNIGSRLSVMGKLMNVAHGKADLGVRYGKDDWPGINKARLMDEEAVLVCSPCIASVDKMSCRERLATQKFIHDDVPHLDTNFPGWDDILAATQTPAVRDDRLHINSTSVVILATLSGRGTTIVRGTLIRQLLTDG